MLPVASGKYVSRQTANLSSIVYHLTACAVSPFGTAYHLPLRKRWDNKTPCHFERSEVEKSLWHHAAHHKWGYVSRHTASLKSDRLTSLL